MITREQALRMTPGRAWLLGCLLFWPVVGAACIAWDHRGEVLDHLADLLPIRH